MDQLKIHVIFSFFVILCSAGAELPEDNDNSLRRLLNDAGRRAAAIQAGPADVRRSVSYEINEQRRQIKEALLLRKINEGIAKRWIDDPIRGTSERTTERTTTSPTTTKQTTTTTSTVAPSTIQGNDFWETFWKLWKNRHNPFG